MARAASADNMNDSDFKLMAKLDQESYPDIKPQSFTSLSGFFEQGNHISIFGKTGSGKSVLLQSLLRDFYDHGFKIIHRDDGGHDYLKVVEFQPITVWVPRECKFKCEHPNLTQRSYDREKPAELVDALLAARRELFNVVLLDTFVLDWELSADFWSRFLKAFITRLMSMDVTEKTKIVLSIDELNDLIQPAHFQLTETHNQVRAMIELCIRKLRKHGVKLIATAHRPNQLTRNIRSEFSFGLVKQCCGSDLYNFLNHELVHLASSVFWKVLKDIKDLTPQYFYLFDKKGNFDKYELPNLPSETPHHTCENILSTDDFTELKGYDMVRLWVKAVMKAMVNQVRTGKVNYRDVQDVVGVPKATVFEVLNQRIFSDLELRGYMDEVLQLAKKGVKVQAVHDLDVKSVRPTYKQTNE